MFRVRSPTRIWVARMRLPNLPRLLNHKAGNAATARAGNGADRFNGSRPIRLLETFARGDTVNAFLAIAMAALLPARAR